jgi:hypothetical protein
MLCVRIRRIRIQWPWNLWGPYGLCEIPICYHHRSKRHVKLWRFVTCGEACWIENLHYLRSWRRLFSCRSYSQVPSCGRLGSGQRWWHMVTRAEWLVSKSHGIYS